MPTRQRQPLYQLYLSLVATAYTFCNPPRRLEEHLRSLEGLDNLVLFYSVLGCYTFSVFLLLYWGVFSLATPFVVRFFHALVWAFGALGKGLPFLKYAIGEYVHVRCHARVIETSLDWELREDRYKHNVSALQKKNDALDTNLTTAVKARRRTRSALKREKARVRKRDAEIEQRKRTSAKIIRRLVTDKHTLASRIVGREVMIDARDAFIRQLEVEVTDAQVQISDLVKQLTDAENLARTREISAKDLTAKTLEQEVIIKGLATELVLEKRARGYWVERAWETDGVVDDLQVSLGAQEDVNDKLGGELENQKHLTRAAEDKIAELEVRNGELDASNETLIARIATEEGKVSTLDTQNVALQATVSALEVKIKGCEENVAALTAKADTWESKAHKHESSVTEWKALATEAEAQGKKLKICKGELEAEIGELRTCKGELEAEIGELKTCIAEHKLRATALVADIDEGKAIAREHEATAARWKARTAEQEAKAADLETRNAQLETNITDLRAEVAHLESRSNEFAAQAEDWESKARNYEGDAAGWKARANETQARADDLETRKHELEAEVGGLRSYITGHELRATALVKEINEVKTAALSHENSAAEWEARATRQQGRADRLEDHAADLELAVLELKGSLVDRDNTIETLETRGRDLATKLGDVEDRVLILEAAAHEWEDLAHEHEAAIEQWKARAAELQGKADDMAGSVAEVEARALDLGNALTKAEVNGVWLDTRFRTELARANALDARALELEDSAMNWEIRAIQAEQSADEWEARAGEHAVRADTLETRVVELESDIQAREARVSELEATIDDRHACLRVAELTGNEWRASALEQEAKAHAAEARIRELEVTVGELESRVEEQEGTKIADNQYAAQLRENLAECQQVVAVFIDRFRQGRDTITDLTRRNASLSSEHEKLTGQVATLEQELQKAQTELAEARVTLDSDNQFKLDADFGKDADLDSDSSIMQWNAMEEQLAAMEAETSTFLISETLPEFDVKDKRKAKEDITDWLESEIDCLKYRLEAAQRELRAEVTKVQEVKAELSRTTKELEAQKRVNTELKKARDALQTKQVATPARVQALKAQKPAAMPLSTRPNVTPNKRVLAPQSKLATPRILTPTTRTQSTRTSGQRENMGPASMELQKDRDALKVKLAASEKHVHDLKAQLANVSDKAGSLQAKLDRVDSGREQSIPVVTHDDELARRLSRRIADLEVECAVLKCRAPAQDVGGRSTVLGERGYGTSLRASPAEAFMPTA